MGSQDSDEDLVELASQGNVDAFETLVGRYQDRVFNLLARMNGTEDGVEDLVQETFIRCWRALGTFRRGSRFYTWLYRIALNAGYTQRRDLSRRRKHEAGSLDANVGGQGSGGDDSNEAFGKLIPDTRESNPLQSIETDQVRQRVREGLDELDEDYRRILVLRDIDGMDYDTIADTLLISRAAVKSRLHRARKELAQVLKDLKP